MNKDYFNNHNAIFSSGGILVYEQKNLVLVLYKKETDEYLFPKGHIDGNESPKETANREIFEETGYENKIKKLIRIQTRPDNLQKDKTKIVFWFYAKLTNPQKHENTQMDYENFIGTWVTFDEAKKLLTWQGDRDLVSVAEKQKNL